MKKVMITPCHLNLSGRTEVFRSEAACAEYFSLSVSRIKQLIDSGNAFKGYFFDYAPAGLLSTISNPVEVD
jgi:hypothetical protein